MSNVKNRIFVDFDGTVIDIKNKCYEIYKNACFKFGLRIFCKDIYWKYRRKSYSEKEIILKRNKNSLKIDQYLSFRLKCLESKQYLDFDKLIINKNKISKIKRCFDLYLITLRKNKKNLLWEINKMNIKELFKEVICSSSRKRQGDFDRKKALLNKFSPFLPTDILIGDTEMDYLLGEKLKIQTLIVDSGIYDQELFLKKYPNMSHILYWNINNIFVNLIKFYKL